MKLLAVSLLNNLPFVIRYIMIMEVGNTDLGCTMVPWMEN